MLVFLFLFSTLLLPGDSRAAAYQGPVLIDYLVDARQPGKKTFQIQARIESLPGEPATIEFPGTERGSGPEGGRLSNFRVVLNDSEVSPLVVEEGRAVLQTSDTEPLVLSYSLASAPFTRLARATYLDETRGFLHARDILLQLEGRVVKSTISFVLPPRWRVSTTAKAVPGGGFQVDPRQPAPFYISEAETIQETVAGDISVTLAIEAGWPGAPSSILPALRQQLMYRRSVAPGSRPAGLLAVFSSSARPLHPKEMTSWGTPELLVVWAAATVGTAGFEKAFRQELARALVECYFPILQDLDDSLNPNAALAYLALKASLKTGAITPGEFLETMARDLWGALGGQSEEADNSRTTPPRPVRPEDAMAASNQQSYFLLDLALTFYGESGRSLEEFLQVRLSERLKAPVSRVDFRRMLAQEHRASRILERLWADAKVVPIRELLRPFGLLFERRELPDFPFELAEGFQVTRLDNAADSQLQIGDRILTVNGCKLLMPDDLLKCRSRLGGEREVELSVERGGGLLRFRQRISKEVLLKLEFNKLSDADKQEKLERFLSRHSQAA